MNAQFNTASHNKAGNDYAYTGKSPKWSHVSIKKPKDALAAYELDLASHPKRLNGVYGAAVAAKRFGDEEKARLYFESLLKLSTGSDSDRPELNEAQKYIRQI